MFACSQGPGRLVPLLVVKTLLYVCGTDLTGVDGSKRVGVRTHPIEITGLVAGAHHK